MRMDSIELDAAVAAGLIDQDQALKLRNFRATTRQQTLADEERFGSIDGMSDVMTAVGLCFALGALSCVAFAFGPWFAPVIAIAAWGLAEVFTLRRRLAVTSFVVFIAYIVAMTVFGFTVALTIPVTKAMLLAGSTGDVPIVPPLQGLVTAAVATGAVVLYWLRFRLPVAYTVALVAAINVLVHVLRLIAPGAPGWVVATVQLGAGLLLFAIAMGWDLSDIRRETRRADVAFWVHLAAGYQIASAVFKLVLGLAGMPEGWDRLTHFGTLAPSNGGALAVIGVALVFTLLALAIDRRSLLMSSLAYILPAAVKLASVTGDSAPVLAAFLVGLFLAVLAVCWRRLRTVVVAGLPVMLRAQLPRTDLTFERARPVQ